jgi:hypothetical protein
MKIRLHLFVVLLAAIGVAQGNNGTSPPPAWTAKQPPVYLVSGGAPLTTHAALGLAVYHYLIFTVNGNDVTVTFKKL